MKSCKKCRERHTCTSICAEVERRLPKDDTGKDAHVEVAMDTTGFEAALAGYSCDQWRHYEIATKQPKLDLSRLTHKELRAVLLLSKGMSQRDVAARLKISRASLRSRINSAFAKLYPAHFSHIVEGENRLRQSGKEEDGI